MLDISGYFALIPEFPFFAVQGIDISISLSVSNIEFQIRYPRQPSCQNEIRRCRFPSREHLRRIEDRQLGSFRVLSFHVLNENPGRRPDSPALQIGFVPQIRPDRIRVSGKTAQLSRRRCRHRTGSFPQAVPNRIQDSEKTGRSVTSTPGRRPTAKRPTPRNWVRSAKSPSIFEFGFGT